VKFFTAAENDVHPQSFCDSHVRDAAALTIFFADLEARLRAGGPGAISELDAADTLEKCLARVAGDMFVFRSFSTISSSCPNGGVVHYSPQHGSADLRNVEHGVT
jgi:Xaa-Pro aminopeptidase